MQKKYASIDKEIIEFELEQEAWFSERLQKYRVAAIYRTGSRADGTSKPNADMDYLILLDKDFHYGDGYICYSFIQHPSLCHAQVNILCYNDMNDTIRKIDKAYFTKRDLQNPRDVSKCSIIIKNKLLYLYERMHGKRELLYGTDVFDEWLAKDIQEIFQEFSIDEEFRKIAREQGLSVCFND